MSDTINPAERTAKAPITKHDGPVVLVNRFVVDPSRDAAFVSLWERTSHYFRARPGYMSLRLHRALSPDATHRYVNVATWSSAAAFRAAHETNEFFEVVGQPAWAEFPSNPTLYEIITDDDAGSE
jgi:heme-degrading monooxygenase HmoA